MRIVLDTNQLVRALKCPPQLATFMMAWEAQRFDVVASLSLLREYDRVLAYPEIAAVLYPELIRLFRSSLHRYIEIVDPTNVRPICRDPDDDKVIATAVDGRVDYLVTEDNDLLTPEVMSVLDASGIQVISSSALIVLLESS